MLPGTEFRQHYGNDVSDSNLDSTVWEALVRRLGLGGATAEVGIFDAEEASIALHHEFGAPRAGIVQRSFMRSTMKERQAEYIALAAKLAQLWITGRISGPNAAAMLGAWAVGAIKAQITHLGNFAPVTAETQRRKGPSYTRPLIRQFGNLVGSVRMRQVAVKITE